MLLKRKKKFLAIITARGGSKSIPKKNIKKLAGKPLIKYTLEAAKKSKLLNRYIVSTDDKEIADYCKRRGAEVPFMRPKYLATDTAKSLDVLVHAVKYLEKKEGYRPDYIITLQPTSPLRTSQDIDNSIKLILKNKEADSLVSVIPIQNTHHPYKVMTFNGKYLNQYKKGRVIRRQDLPEFYARNSAIYITKYDILMKDKKIIGNKCLPYFMPKERSIDIDDKFDWGIAKFLLKK